MHANFADWYRRVSIVPNEDTLNKRWTAIEAIVKKPTRDLVLRALRVVAVPKTDPSAELGGAIGVFKENDAAFPMRDNAEELRVLAGAIVHALIEQAPSTQVSDLAALGLVAAAFGARDSHIANPEHLSRAREYVHERGRDIRNASSDTTPPAKVQLTAAHLASVQQACQGNNATGMAEALPALLKELLAHILALQGSFAKESEVLHARLNTQDEELHLLWWLHTAISRDLSVPFAAIGAGAPIVLASEVAELVSQRPGPSFATDLLIQALIDTGHGEAKTSISDVLNATTLEWRKHLVAATEPKTVGPLCPIAFAAACSLETEGTEDWHPLYRKHCEVSLSQPYSSLQLAAQLYNERMFLEVSR
jgi:hypothetical protein